MFGRKRDRRCHEQLVRWDWRDAQPSVHVYFVNSIYQYAQRGTKAYVTHAKTGAVTDAWFWWFRPNVGDYVVTNASFGWGPHNSHDVVYIGDQHDLNPALPTIHQSVVLRAQRHRRRLDRKALRAARRAQQG